MPSDQAVWGIEIGQCALKAIRLRHDPVSNKVEALAFDYIEHPKILSQPDADPDALSREAINTFLSRNAVKGDRICIGVPGQSGLARFIKLPPVEHSRIPEIVKYEARQQIPFALEEVVWDFQTIGKAEEAEGFSLETEIGLFAMKRDLIFRYMNPFREAGVEVDCIQMRPLAVYNFAAFDQLAASGEGGAEEEKEEGEGQREELVASKKPVASDVPAFIVLLDMGADNSDLVITDGTRIWQRNLPIGGNHFTRALTKELKLTFAKAEHLKRNATKAQDPRAIFQAMRPVFNDLVSEIQRSVGYFSSVHRQSKITKIIGMGNAFKLPGLQKFLGQNLQYEVEKVENFKSLKGDQVLSAPAFQENVLSFTVVYGLALQAMGVSGIRTNLLPPEITQTRMIRRKKPWALSAAAILMAGFTCLFFGNWAQLHAVNAPAFEGAKENAKEAQKLQSAKQEAFNKVKGEWGLVKTNGENLTSNVEKRQEWIEILSAITKALPNNPANAERKKLTDLAEVQVTSISARYFEDVKTEWYDKLVNNPLSWAKPTLQPLDEKEPPTGPGWVFTLDGYHFNKGGQIFTVRTLLETTNSFQSPPAREVGIKCAVLDQNYPEKNWSPWADQKSAGRSRKGSQGSAGAGQAGSGAGRMAGMGMGMGGGGEEQNSRGGARDRAGRGGNESNEPGSGTGGDQATGSPERSRITNIMRTSFVLEFVWQPIEKSKRKDKDAAYWFAQIQKHGPRVGTASEALLKYEPSKLPAPDAGQQAPGTPLPGQPPAGQPTTAAPGAPQQPAGTPGTGQPPASQPPPGPGNSAAPPTNPPSTEPGNAPAQPPK